MRHGCWSPKKRCVRGCSLEIHWRDDGPNQCRCLHGGECGKEENKEAWRPRQRSELR